MLGLCHGLAVQAHKQCTRSQWKLIVNQGSPCFGLVNRRDARKVLVNGEPFFVMSAAYYDLLDACPLRMCKC